MGKEIKGEKETLATNVSGTHVLPVGCYPAVSVYVPTQVVARLALTEAVEAERPPCVCR